MTFRSRKILSALLLCLVCCTATAPGQNRSMSQYIRDFWPSDGGFPGGQVSAIAQTKDGCLWIGGDKGLVRFDGLSFQLLQESSKGVPITKVLGLATDAEGGLWVWMQGANVLRYYDGHFENATAALGLPDGFVTAMSQTRGGDVLLSTVGQETFEYTSGRLHSVGTIQVPGTLILASAKTEDGAIWIGTSDNGLFRIKAGNISRMDVPNALKKVNVLLSGPHNTLWVGTDQGLLLWDGQQLSRAGVPPTLRSNSFFTMTSASEGTLWAGGPQGLFRLERQTEQDAAFSAAHSNSVPTALFQDREGDLWIGSTDGLQRWREGAFITYASTPGFPRGSSGPIFADAIGRLWFGPESGGLASLTNGQLDRHDVAHLAGDIVYSISGAGADLWIGRQRGGLTHLTRTGSTYSSKTYATADGLAQNSVYVVKQTRDGTVWAGTLSAGLSRLQKGVFRTFTTADGLASNAITALEQDDKDNLWVGTPAGLSVLRDGVWRSYGTQDGLPADEVNTLLPERSSVGSEMWIGTAKGLGYFSSGRMRSFPGTPDLLHEPVLGLAKDPPGYLWIATQEHVLRVNPSKLLAGNLAATEIRVYDRSDGLLSSQIARRSQSMLADGRGSVWVSTRGGLSATDPADLARPPVPALVRVVSVLADGQAVSTQPLRIPASQRRVTLQFSGVSLPVPERVRYRYRLDGFDKDWSEPSTTREAVYTNLGPGNYSFHVVASNSDGVWNASDVSQSFWIEPAVWQTWWFHLATALCVALTLWSIYLIRTRQLANQLHLRFEERLAERMRIAQDLHDTLLQGFLSASLQLDVASEYVPQESPAAPMLSRVLLLMRQVSEDCRNALAVLRIGEKQHQNLEGELSAVPQQLGLEDRALYRVVVNGSPRALNPLCSHELYLVGREAVVNAYRHAGATLIEVELVYNVASLHLFVRDDGRGIEEAVLQSGKERHWGLTGMRERATKVGAQFRIYSRTAKGTEIELVVPSRVAYMRDRGEKNGITRMAVAFKQRVIHRNEKTL